MGDFYRQLRRHSTALNMAEQSYEGIDFDAIQETCGLEKDEIKVLKICFGMFDVKHQDFLSADDLDDILRAMGFRPSKEELREILAEVDTKLTSEDLDGIIEEIDEDGSGTMDFDEFCQMRISNRLGFCHFLFYCVKILRDGSPGCVTNTMK